MSQTVARAEASPAQISAVARKYGRSVTIAQVRAVIEAAIADAYLAWQLSMAVWVDKYVPMLTGALRASLKRSTQQGSKVPTRALFRWGSDLFYAPFVNKKPTSSLQHGVDPQAQHGFLQLGRLEARRAAKQLVKQAVQAAVAGTAIKYGDAARIIKVVNA